MLPCQIKCVFCCTCRADRKNGSTKMLHLHVSHHITPVWFKYLSYNKAFHFKASSPYFLLAPGIEWLIRQWNIYFFPAPSYKGKNRLYPPEVWSLPIDETTTSVTHSEKNSHFIDFHLMRWHVCLEYYDLWALRLFIFLSKARWKDHSPFWRVNMKVQPAFLARLA